MIRAAVLTISDSSHAGTREDRSGPALVAALERRGFDVTVTEVLRDERREITSKLTSLTDGATVDFIVTTGGTGVAPRDVTPEAVRDVIEREIPGFGELMRAEGLKKTPRAALSRSMAGLRGAVLIVCVPGSPKGAVESLDAIVGLVPHVIDLARGSTAHD